jgi:hypothetical protein
MTSKSRINAEISDRLASPDGAGMVKLKSGNSLQTAMIARPKGVPASPRREMEVGDWLMSGLPPIESFYSATDADFTLAFQDWGLNCDRNVIACGAGPDGNQRYPVSDEILNTKGGQIVGPRQAAAGFSVSNRNGRTFNMAAQSVYRLDVESSNKSAGLKDFGIFFDQPNDEGMTRANIIQYPVGIKLQNVARPDFGNGLRIESAWDGIDARGNTGGLQLGYAAIGALNTALHLNGAQDFVGGHLHLWPFGLEGYLLDLYRDGIAQRLMVGRCDGFGMSIDAFDSRLCFYNDGGAAAFGEIKALKLDGRFSRIEGACREMSIGSWYKSSNIAGDFAAATTGGLWSFPNLLCHLDGGASADASLVAGISGNVMTVTTATPGTLRIGQTIYNGATRVAIITGTGNTQFGGVGTYRVARFFDVAPGTALTATGAAATILNDGGYLTVGEIVQESGATDAPMFRQTAGTTKLAGYKSLYATNTNRTAPLLHNIGGDLTLDKPYTPGIGTGAGDAIVIENNGVHDIDVGHTSGWGIKLPSALSNGRYNLKKTFTSTPVISFATPGSALVVTPGANFVCNYQIIDNRIVGVLWADWTAVFDGTTSGALQIATGIPYAPAEVTPVVVSPPYNPIFAHTSGTFAEIGMDGKITIRYAVSGGAGAYFDTTNFPSGTASSGLRALINYRI